MTLDNAVCLRVWGDYACFTRPEMKVERVSYPVPTPSAARGILEAIFWKPQFRWIVREIHVLNEIRFASFVRNEVKQRQSVDVARRWSRNGGGFAATDDRTQRHTLALRDVAYMIRADLELVAGGTDDPAKYRDQFRRRVRTGACFSRPYLGCREFAAQFAEPTGQERTIRLDDDLGRMLHSLRYAPDGTGSAEPAFFDARLVDGVLHVPRSA